MKTLLLLLFCCGPAQLSVIVNHTWYNPRPQTWWEAQKSCRTYKADLATVRSSADLNISMTWYQAWFGLHRASADLKWQWVDSLRDEPIPEFSTEPSSTENCASVDYNSNLVWPYTCDILNFFFCQGYEGEIIFINKTANWEEAREYCRDLDTNLSTFDISSPNSPANVPRSFPVWTGLRTNEDGSMSWSSGLHSDFRNWTQGSDSGHGSSPTSTSGSCVAVSSLSRSMSVQSCYDAFPFLCQKHNVVLVLRHLSWEEALEHCSDNSDLQSWFFPNDLYPAKPFNLLSLNEEDLDFAVLQTNEANTTKVWVGLQFLAGSWVWSDGTPVSLTSLPPCPKFHCGALDVLSRTIQPTDCNEKLNLLCYQMP